MTSDSVLREIVDVWRYVPDSAKLGVCARCNVAAKAGLCDSCGHALDAKCAAIAAELLQARAVMGRVRATLQRVLDHRMIITPGEARELLKALNE